MIRMRVARFHDVHEDDSSSEDDHADDGSSSDGDSFEDNEEVEGSSESEHDDEVGARTIEVGGATLRGGWR